MEVEERLGRERHWDTGKEDLWTHKIALMECCWGMIKGESGVGLRLADLYTNLAVSPGPAKSRNLVLAVCCSNLCALLTQQSSLSEANHWFLQAQVHSQGLPYLGLASWIDQIRPVSLLKPPLHSKFPAFGLTKAPQTQETAVVKPTLSFTRLIQHSATTPPSAKRPSGKRRKTGLDDYSQIEKLLKHPVARSKAALTEPSSDFSLDCKAPSCDRLNSTETSGERRNRSERETAVRKIQRVWTQYRAKKKEKETKAAVLIQIWYRNRPRRQAGVCICTFAQRYALQCLQIAAKSTRKELKTTKNAVILQCWFRQKLGLVALWLETEGKKALESASDYPLSISTKPETLSNSFSLDFPPPTGRSEAALRIQKTYRAHRTAAQYAGLRRAVVRLQAWSRGRIAYFRYSRVRRTLFALQSRWRGVLLRRKIAQYRAKAVKIQAVYRGWTARKALQRVISAAQRIQRYVRTSTLLSH